MSSSFASSPAARLKMQRQRRRDTAPELALRKALFARGHRYRVHRRPEPGLNRSADLVFTRERVAVFVDGCFWHGCDRHGTCPTANRAWWEEKLAATRRRDADTDLRLLDAGWVVVRLWEHATIDEGVAAVEEALTVKRGGRRGLASTRGVGME